MDQVRSVLILGRTDLVLAVPTSACAGQELAARVRTVLRRARYGPDLIHTQRAVGYSLRLPRG